MARVTVGQPATITATIQPASGVDFAGLAETAWVLAQLDAMSVCDYAERAVALQQRIQNGEAWFKTHGANDEQFEEARVLLLNLRDALDIVLIVLRGYERTCWIRVLETCGFVRNAGSGGFAIQISLFGGTITDDDAPRALWDSLLPGREPPQPGVGGQWTIEPGRTGAAVWEIPALRELLQTKRNRQEAE